jgi:AraC family transcriptional regulator, L-rhamnose operon regulatory protein RhaS
MPLEGKVNGRAINDAAIARSTASKRQQLWFARSGQYPRPLLPEIQSLGRGSLATVYSDRALRSADGQVYEVSCMLRGTDGWRAGGRLLSVGPGDLLIAGPQHSIARSSTRAPPGELCWLSLRLDATPGSFDSMIAEALDRHALRIVQGSPLLPALFDRLLAEHRIADEHGGWAARGALHCLLAELLRAYETVPRGTVRPAASEAIAAALAIIEERLAEPLTVAALAAGVQLSPGQFHDRFLHETGYTPADYWSRRRLARARELLVDRGLSITDVALTLGFSTSQYFATFFRRFTGISPRDYRRQLRVQ